MSTQTSLSETQTAIYNVLVPAGTLDTTLSGLGVLGVFDFRAVPENQAFDYITIGDSIESPDNTFGRRGYNSIINLHIWSRALGTKTANSILAQLNKLLDQQSLTLTTQSHIFTMYEWSQRIADPDGLTLHVSVRYRLFTQE